MCRTLLFPLFVLAVLAGCVRVPAARKDTDRPRRKAMALTVTSSAFKAGERIPKKYTGEGADVSPPLSWSGAPAGTQEFALICDDPDAPTPKPWVHWVVYKIPADRPALGEDGAGGALEGRNGWPRMGYGGPMPPPGHGVHRYYFKVYALDQPLGLKPGATKEELVAAMEGHILDQGELVGTYERKR